MTLIQWLNLSPMVFQGCWRKAWQSFGPRLQYWTARSHRTNARRAWGQSSSCHHRWHCHRSTAYDSAWDVWRSALITSMSNLKDEHLHGHERLAMVCADELWTNTALLWRVGVPSWCVIPPFHDDVFLRWCRLASLVLGFVLLVRPWKGGKKLQIEHPTNPQFYHGWDSIEHVTYYLWGRLDPVAHWQMQSWTNMMCDTRLGIRFKLMSQALRIIENIPLIQNMSA